MRNFGVSARRRVQQMQARFRSSSLYFVYFVIFHFARYVSRFRLQYFYEFKAEL